MGDPLLTPTRASFTALGGTSTLADTSSAACDTILFGFLVHQLNSYLSHVVSKDTFANKLALVGRRERCVGSRDRTQRSRGKSTTRRVV
jgi:hypothetical protein